MHVYKNSSSAVISSPWCWGRAGLQGRQLSASHKHGLADRSEAENIYVEKISCCALLHPFCIPPNRLLIVSTSEQATETILPLPPLLHSAPLSPSMLDVSHSVDSPCTGGGQFCMNSAFSDQEWRHKKNYSMSLVAEIIERLIGNNSEVITAVLLFQEILKSNTFHDMGS
ncbi:hypothetical protein AV530_014355 [Patagioenas fasciata monilis]|uniref:Uncharacterized protein n=1 Tax=Patagioenas fasciata monilis TaxID=372326 RepID=A0A1V4KBF9_PATFA|nr:hypothetical protein AV530_014355 [Patagioenas fasciata monilis]